MRIEGILKIQYVINYIISDFFIFLEYFEESD
jgi:hypothetical protein